MLSGFVIIDTDHKTKGAVMKEVLLISQAVRGNRKALEKLVRLYNDKFNSIRIMRRYTIT